MKLTTKEMDAIWVHKYMSKEGTHVELKVETGLGEAFAYLSPKEAVQLGNALVKAAQPKKQQKEGK